MAGSSISSPDKVYDALAVKELFVNTGRGPGFMRGAGMVYSNYTSTGNTSTSETVLGTYTVTANSMPADSGKVVKVKAWGKTAANANNKTIIIYFGATNVATHAVAGSNDKDWVLEATIIQGATGAQTAYGRLYLEGAANELIFVSTPAETQTGDVIVKCTGESGTASNDILMKGMTVEFLN